MHGGDVIDSILQKDHYSEQDAQSVVRDMLSAVNYCHGKNLMHRDLKPENLLLASKTESALVKLADFGFIREDDGECCDILGTPEYMAPEMYTGDSYNKAVDMWAAGVILYTLLCGYPPFYDDESGPMKMKIMNGQYYFHDEFWCNVSSEAKDLISNLLVVDTKRRFNVQECFEHPWMTSSKLPNLHLADSVEGHKSYKSHKMWTKAINVIKNGIIQ